MPVCLRSVLATLDPRPSTSVLKPNIKGAFLFLTPVEESVSRDIIASPVPIVLPIVFLVLAMLFDLSPCGNVGHSSQPLPHCPVVPLPKQKGLVF